MRLISPLTIPPSAPRVTDGVQGARLPFDALARALIEQRQDTQPLGSWPALGEWQALADQAAALAHRSPYAAMLRNAWIGSAKLSSGAVSAEQAEYGIPVPGMELSMGGNRLVRAPGRPPEFMVTPHLPIGGAALFSRENGLRVPQPLLGMRFLTDQSPWRCEAIDSMLLGKPAMQWVASDGARCCLYDPARNDIRALPDVFASCGYAAASGNGRYVVGDTMSGGELLLHDCDNHRTTALQCPSRSEGGPSSVWQLSVDSGGVVFAATREHGLQFHAQDDVRVVELEKDFGNYRLSPNERYVVHSDATGRDLRLEDREGGPGKRLRHPAAQESAPSSQPLAIACARGMPWIATTTEDGVLSLFNLVGTGDEEVVDPALQVPLRMQGPGTVLQGAAPWFDDDLGAVNVVYTASVPRREGRSVQTMRLPLV